MGCRPTIHRWEPWRSFEAVEYATLDWVDWFNNRRLLEPNHGPNSRAATQTNLNLFEARGLIREVTGQGRFRLWRAVG